MMQCETWHKARLLVSLTASIDVVAWSYLLSVML